jgi:hypothetical protein
MDRELDIAIQEIRARISQVDPLLVRLVSFAVQGSVQFQYGIAVRLGGVTILGIPSPARTTGEILDRQTLRFVQIMHAMDLSAGREDTNWSDIEQMVHDTAMFVNAAKYEDEAYSKLLEYVEKAKLDGVPRIADLPDNLITSAITALAPPKALTLTNAVIRRDNGTNENIENIRINLSAVEAWWTFELGAPEDSQDALAWIQRRAEGQAAK